MKKIPLSQGRFALVDDADYKWLSLHKWTLFPRKDRRGNPLTPYAYRKEGRKTVLMHRVIVGAKRGQYTDHKNRNGLDNRRANLRICTQRQNNFNRGSKRGSSSQYKGVHWCNRSQRWIAKAHIGGKAYHFYQGTDERKAALAYNAGIKDLHGEFGCVNPL